MGKLAPDYLPEKISQYVPNMQYAADVHFEGLLRYSLGTPSARDDDAILTGLDADAADVIRSFNGVMGGTIDATYGRNVLIDASGNPGGNVVVTIKGRDYLGQLMAETITNPGNASARVAGQKAFKYIEEVTSDGGGTTANVTITVGVGTVLGLPYKALEVPRARHGSAISTAGTFAQPDTTQPATATSNDPRGTYDPGGAALNGVNEIVVYMRGDADADANGHGGLHGVPHYYA